MSYKIAVASSDGVYVNQSFKEASQFLIYEVDANLDCILLEARKWKDEPQADDENIQESGMCSGGCGNGSGGGCKGANIRKVSLLDDCRSVLCTEFGFRVRKQFASKAISVFDLDCEISEAFEKIIAYYDRIDRHQPFRGSSEKIS